MLPERRPATPRTTWIPAAWVLAALGIAPATLAAGQETIQEEGQAASRAQRYLLHLEDGRVLRTTARRVEGRWEIKRSDGWNAVPAGMVVHARAEKDVLAEARRLGRESTSASSTPLRRLAYVDWLVREGLTAEALTALDEWLEEAPDEAAVLEFLARKPFRLGLPDPAGGLDGFFEQAARFGPAGQELAVQELLGSPEVPGLREKLQTDLLDRDGRRRQLAALTARRIYAGGFVRELLSRAVLDSDADVRLQASLGLRDVGDPGVTLPVLRALGSKNARVRSHAIEALSHMSYAAAVQPLYSHLIALQSGSVGRPPHSNIFVGRQIAYVSDFDVEVAQGSSIADPVVNILNEGSVLDAGVISASQHSVQSELASTRRALSRLTGASPGNTTSAWKRWFNEHGDEWRGTPPPGPPKSPRSSDR